MIQVDSLHTTLAPRRLHGPGERSAEGQAVPRPPFLRGPRPGRHHRRGGRRSVGHCHLLHRRRAVRHPLPVDGAADLAADGRRADDVRAHRHGHRQGACRDAARPLSPAGADRRLPRPARRQHPQHRRRPGRHGRRRRDADRPQFPLVRGRLRSDHCGGHPLAALPAVRLHPQMAVAVARRLRRDRPAPPPGLVIRPARYPQRLAAEDVRGLVDAGRHPGDDHQPLPLLLAGLPGGRRGAGHGPADAHPPPGRHEA